MTIIKQDSTPWLPALEAALAAERNPQIRKERILWLLRCSYRELLAKRTDARRALREAVKLQLQPNRLDFFRRVHEEYDLACGIKDGSWQEHKYDTLQEGTYMLPPRDGVGR